jgi:hypothetical protein
MEDKKRTGTDMSDTFKICEGCTDPLLDCNWNWHECKGNCACIECARTPSEKLAAIDRRENEEAWREQAPKLGIHPDMFVKKSEREALGFFEEDRYV